MQGATRRAWLGGAIAASAVLTRATRAQTYPSRPVRLIMPSTAGSPTDTMARLLANALTTRLGQSFFVDTRPGAGGTLGTRAVVSAEPDGATLLFTEGAKHLMTGALYPDLPYDPLSDLTPIATAGAGAFVLAVSPDIPVRSVGDLVALAKAKPGTISFGFGQGTLPHMLGEMLKSRSGADIVSVPYKGGSQAIADMLGGRIQMHFGTTSSLGALAQQGKVRLIAVTNDKRLPELPAVPTMADSGFDHLTLRYWMGLWGPPKLPASIVMTLNEAANQSLRSSEMQASMAKLGYEVNPTAMAELPAFMASEHRRAVELARVSGVKGD